MALLTNGHVAITWYGKISGKTGNQVFLRIYDEDANAISEIIIVTTTTSNTKYPRIISLTDGGCLVTYYYEDFSAIKARRY